MEIMGGGGSSSANAGNTIEFLLNNEKLPCYSNNCLLRLLLIRRCRVALMNNKFKTLNSILDNENERIEKLFNEHSIRDSISIGEGIGITVICRQHRRCRWSCDGLTTTPHRRRRPNPNRRNLAFDVAAE